MFSKVFIGFQVFIAIIFLALILYLVSNGFKGEMEQHQTHNDLNKEMLAELKKITNITNQVSEVYDSNN